MDLKLIPHKTCPTCHARVVAEECRSIHCNREGFEVRTFECGCVFAWCPNGSLLEQRNRCRKDPEEILFQQKRKQATEALLKFIEGLDVDKVWKDNKVSYLKY